MSPADDEPEPTQSRYHPTNKMPLAGQLPDTRPRFNTQRENFLLGYRNFDTLRAYWGDLEHIADWAEERGKDPLQLTKRDLKQYVALLRRRKYSEATVRRRTVVYGLLRRHTDGGTT